ncbi:uncharacterized protein LOC110030495 isoform X2 [Phalaenopsis equestris]|uniref:uncharacterized protein LOC110030495 isoform X2 n=1 Tax=Phalaenopsis equestris TaxID=78828 RepID=UPI0009E3AD8A|nr:uncharacterized protein LOC110030495 isoform X2 [Phalaenopsis equestris]
MATDMQPKPFSDSDNITDKEDDVKVCDICGDAGLEDSLAICSRCLDGAEHIYCMETMLDELPKGDWLCEECKLKEYENQMVHKFEVVTKTHEQPYFDEGARHDSSTIYSKSPPKNEGSAIKDGTYEKALERSPVYAETSVARDVSLLCPKDSLANPDAATIAQSNPEKSGPQLKPSSIRNTITKPKVKQLLGAVPLALNATGKFHSKNTREGGLTRGMAKSTSFKTEKGVCNDFELLNEKQTVKLTHIKNSSVEKNKELGVIERDNSFSDRGLIDGDCSGYNREIQLHSSRSSVSACPNGLNLLFQKQGQIPKEGFHLYVNAATHSGKPDTVSQRNNHLRMESAHQDDMSKIAAFSTTSNKPISGGSQILQCQKCNETGHPTNLCSNDERVVTAIKLSSDPMPWENANRSNKGKAARDTIMPKQEALKFTDTTNQSKKPSICHSAEVINKNFPSPCSRRTYSQEGKANATQSFVFADSESTEHQRVANQNEIHHEVGAGRLNSFGNISEEFNVKLSEPILPTIDSSLSNMLRTSVIPEHEFFWQGGFEVLRAGRLTECCDGLQAHFSSYASSKVLEAAKNFPPYKVQLEEVPCISSWPPQFHGNHAKEKNIALFFFAKDIESYRSSYCKLLDKMLKFDLALKGYFGGFELLIFPSNKLSENSQRWNRLLFLWGTFKGGRSSSLEVLSNGKQGSSKSTIHVILPPTLPEASKYQETYASKISSEADNYAAPVEASPALSTGIENRISNESKYVYHTSVDAELLPEDPCPLSSGLISSSHKSDS